MTSKKENKTLGMVLLISLVLLYVSIHLVPTKYISSLAILGVAIYLLLT